MKNNLFSFFFLVCCLSVQAGDLSLSEEKLQSLAQDSQWLDLIHFHQTGLSSQRVAQVDGDGFYLSGNDETADPEMELILTLKGLEETESPDKVACRYPARYEWLKKNFPQHNFVKFDCPDFEAWSSRIDAKSLTLIFPAAYLNSPSSMYGHTFLRIDRRSGENDLLDYSVNFAANTDADDNELVFTYKGLSGGYPGVFSVLPYYEKVNEYSYLESRDVWEYSLTLSQEEVAQFVRHLWEVKDTTFDYYFFDENCSYQLLTLLDAASERFQFTREFRFSAIPADTVKVVANSDIVGGTRFRPSVLSQMQNMIGHLSSSQKRQALELVDANVSVDSYLSDFPPEQQAQVLDVAYQYARYLAMRKKQTNSGLGSKSIKLLSARSKLQETQVFPEIPTPTLRPDQGHASSRVFIGSGYSHKNHYQELAIRAAYHDHLDSLDGFSPGAQLEMFNATVRRTEQSDGHAIRLQRLDMISIASYTPRNAFISPFSWHVSAGWYRPEAAPDELVTYLNGGGGLAYMLGEQIAYFQLSAEVNLDNDIEHGHRIAVGPKVGILRQSANWSAKLEAYLPVDLSGAKFKLKQIGLELSRVINDSLQARVALNASNLNVSEKGLGKSSGSTFNFYGTGKSVNNRAFSIGLAYYF